MDRSDSMDVTGGCTNTRNCPPAVKTSESGVVPRSQMFTYFFESSSSIAVLKVAYGDAPTIFFTAFTLPSDVI